MRRGALIGLLNLITLSRLVFAVLFVLFKGAATRAALVVLAGLSDVVDGWLARRLRLTSTWGAIADPAADHIFVIVAFLTLVADGALSFLDFLILVTRDIATAVGFLVARAVRSLRQLRFHARPAGKAVTVLQLATLLAALLLPGAIGWLVVATGVVSAFALADYGAWVWRSRA